MGRYHKPLSLLHKSFSGLQSPFAYESAQGFGAAFACHLEDYNLHSVNYLHVGRKVWTIIAPKDKELLEQKLHASRLIKPETCAQAVRHASFYISYSILDQWGIDYTIIDQRVHEILIAFIGVYDNFEQSLAVQDQRSDHNQEFYSVTTCQFIVPIWMPAGGLLQSMLNRSHPFDWTEIAYHIDMLQVRMLVNSRER